MGKQLITEPLECPVHALARADARAQAAGEGQHLLGGARAEVGVVRTVDAVGAAQRLAEPGGQRAAPGFELGAGMVPVVGGPRSG